MSAAAAVDPSFEKIKIVDENLEIIDTFHDFCTKERKKKGQGKDTDDGDEVSETKLDSMRGYVAKILNNDINTYLSNLTGGKVTLSDLENKTVEYYEAQNPDVRNTKRGEKITITYDNILKGWNSDSRNESPLWRKFRLNQDINSILEINKGSKSANDYSVDEKIIIASFIINYFFGTTEGNKYCTFDANAGIFAKIFEDIEQMKNIIFPQTIADSAVTTFGTMKGRNEFIFPGLRREFPFVSNVYSKLRGYSMRFINRGFNSKKPFGFSIDIAGPKGIVAQLPFSATQTEGPSVNYLIDIIQAPPNSNWGLIQKKPQMLNVGKALNSNPELKADAYQNGLLLDLKRAGDHEATAVAQYMRLRYPEYTNLIFVTIDLLCALESRRRQNPTVWHYGERMILYRFPIDRAITEINSLKDKITDTVESLQALLNVKTNILTQLNELKQEAAAAKSIEDIPKKLINMEISQFIKNLLYHRMQYLIHQIVERIVIVEGEVLGNDHRINRLIDNLSNIHSSLSLETINKELIDKLKIQIEMANQFIKIAFTAINTLFQANISLEMLYDEKGFKYKLNVYNKLIKAGVFLEAANPVFNYDTTPFFDLYDTLLKHLNANRAMRARARSIFLQSQGESFQRAIQDILDQFSEPYKIDLKKTIPLFNVDDFTGSLQNQADPFGWITSLISTGGGAGASASTGAGAGSASFPFGIFPRQSGGGDPQQYLDLANLLFNISGMAAAFIESAYSELYPLEGLKLQLSVINNYIEHYYSPIYIKKRFGFVSVLENTYFMARTLLSQLYHKNISEIHDVPIENALQNIKIIINNNDRESFISLYNHINTIHTQLNSILLPSIPEAYKNKPSIYDFLNTLSINDEYRYAANNLKDEIQQTWEEGLFEIQNDKNYKYHVNHTAKLITLILALQNDHTYQFILQNEGQTLIDDTKDKLTFIYTDTNSMSYQTTSIPILFFFTLLENIQNPNTFSFFLKPLYKNWYFNSKSHWEGKLYQYINSGIFAMWNYYEIQNTYIELVPKGLQGGSKRKRYAKTRRQAKKLTRKRKTRRARK